MRLGALYTLNQADEDLDSEPTDLSPYLKCHRTCNSGPMQTRVSEIRSTARREWKFLRADLRRSTDQFGRMSVTLMRFSRILGPAGVITDVLARIICGVEIPRSVRVGPGLRLPHGGRGTVVHWQSTIGSNVTVYHGVTLGVSGPDQRAPHLCSNSYIGTGACILGGVTIGDGARVGANSVVLQSTPPGVTAAGVPAVLRVNSTSEQLHAKTSRHTPE